MTSMRVTEGSAAWGSLAGLQSSASTLAQLQSQMSSGRQITKPSDSPTGTTQALGLRAELKRMTQYDSNASDAQGWLTTSGASLTSAITQLQQVRTTVLQGMNTGVNDAASNNALAQQVDQIKQSMLALANTTYLGRPVFGGTTSGSVAFDASGNYVGDSGSVQRTIGSNATVTVNSIGTDVFGANGNNIFTVLDSISNDLRTNPSALSGDLASLDGASAKITAAQGQAGALSNRIQGVQTANGTTETQLKSQLSDLQDIDLADMAIKVSSADAAYQAALATTAKVRQTSLLDFLR